MLTVNRNKIILDVVLGLLLFFFIFAGNPILLSVYIVFLNICILLRIKNHKIVFFIYLLILYININFLIPIYIDTSTTIFINELSFTEYSYVTLICCALFLYGNELCLNILTTKEVKKFEFKNNKYIFYFFMLVELFVLVFGINRVDGSNYVVRVTTLYELSYFFIYFMILYSGGNKKKIALTLILSAAIIIQDLIFDGRITSVQIILLLFAIFYNRIPKLYFVIIGVILFIALVYVGQTRISQNFSFSLYNNLLKIDTFYFAYQASETHVYAATQVDLNLQLTSFLGNFLNIFFIDIPAVYHVSEISLMYAHHYYGGYLFTWFYFWFGYIGAFISGLIVAFVISYNAKRKKDINNTILILIFCTLVRWYIYEPTILFKYAILSSSIILYITRTIDKLISYNKKLIILN